MQHTAITFYVQVDAITEQIAYPDFIKIDRELNSVYADVSYIASSYILTLNWSLHSTICIYTYTVNIISCCYIYNYFVIFAAAGCLSLYYVF